MADGTQMVSVTGKDGSIALVPFAANCMPVCAPQQAAYLTPGRFAVNDVTQMEGISQPLYSYQTYPAAGSQSLVFFQNPTGGGSTTLEDTNMLAAGSLPGPQKFLIQGVYVDFLSGLAGGTLGADTANSAFADTWAVLKRGVLSIDIGTKNYLQMSPLMALPPRAHMNGVAAVASATTAAAALQTVITAGYSDGDVFKPIPMLLEATQNFRATITFPAGAVALPSTNATSRIGVVLAGTLYRSPQ